MKIKNLFLLAALGLMASATLTSCEDILGEWSRPTPTAVTPSAIAVTGITLDADATINLGETKTLTATVAPDNATDKTVSWRSEDETVATVADGVVTAVAAGTATITATANDGSGVKATCEVTVKIPGLLAGKFTINDNATNNQVQFSQGNLQYQASTQTWRFAENQYDYVGNAVGNTTSTVRDSQADWIDLFGWGTAGHSFASGYGEYYQPWATENSDATKYGPTDGTSSLTGTYAQGDWGTNAISNGGNAENSGWRTLTGGSGGEWEWILGPSSSATPGTNCRTSSTIGGTANARFVKATVHSTKGVIIFPDEITWNTTTMGTAPTTCNTTNNSFTYSPSDDNWTALETAGCVFLPAAGYRGFTTGTTVQSAGSRGRYWSSTVNSANNAYFVDFPSGNLSPALYSDRYYGFSVRLVRPAE